MNIGIHIEVKIWHQYFYNIADIAVNGKIQISGNNDAIVFEYTTDIGSYKIAVPTYNKKKTNVKIGRSGFGLRD